MKLKHLHYAWVMVIISAGVLMACASVTYVFGVFLTPLTTAFNWDRGALSVAVSIRVLLGGLVSPLGGRLCDRYGPRPLVIISGLLIGIGFLLMSQVSSLWQVYLIWGLFIGTGFGCCFISIISTIPRWFIKRRGLAMGITAAGQGLGGIISPPLAQWLISAYSWQQAFIVLGLMTLVIVIPVAQFMKHSPQRIGLKPYGENETVEDKQPLGSDELSFSQAIKTSPFWLFGLTLFGFFFCFKVILVHIVPYAGDIGISAIVAASILSIFAGFSVVGRLSIGFISDRLGTRLALSACLILMTLALIWLLFTKEIWMLYVFAVVFGFVCGGVSPLETIVTAELFGLKSLGIILGGLSLFLAMGGVVGAPLAGSIFDVTGSYWLAFLICIAICSLAVILSLILLRYKGKTDMAMK